MSTIGKSATKTWREQIKKGQTTLGFSAWITREKEKLGADGSSNNLLLVDRTLNDSVHAAIASATAEGLQPKPKGNKVFGIDKTVFIISALLLIAGTVYLLTRIGKTK